MTASNRPMEINRPIRGEIRKYWLTCEECGEEHPEVVGRFVDAKHGKVVYQCDCGAKAVQHVRPDYSEGPPALDRDIRGDMREDRERRRENESREFRRRYTSGYEIV